MFSSSIRIAFHNPEQATTRCPQVGSDRAEIVARNLVQTPSLPCSNIPGKNAGSAQLRSSSRCLLDHFHFSDPFLYMDHRQTLAAFALVDSVRAVQVNFTATNGLTGAAERLRAITRLIRLPNAGMAVKRTCGDEPILGVNISAAEGPTALGEPAVNLTWGQAVDEAGGEGDVTRYVVCARRGESRLGGPYLSIP